MEQLKSHEVLTKSECQVRKTRTCNVHAYCKLAEETTDDLVCYGNKLSSTFVKKYIVCSRIAPMGSFPKRRIVARRSEVFTCDSIPFISASVYHLQWSMDYQYGAP